MKRAALYLRVSTGDQDTANQRPEVEQLAARRGFEAALVVEEAVSTKGKRPGWERVMEAARQRKIDAVVIWALDRFGRSMVGNLVAVLELDRLGVEVLSVREPWIDNAGDSPVRPLLVAIFSWVAEQERRQRAARTVAGLQRVRAKGIKLGRPRRRERVNVDAARSMKATTGQTWAQIAAAFGVSRATLLREVGK